LHKKSNPTHGSGWMLQILSTMSHVFEVLKSHQRELVDGSDPFYRITFALEILNCTYFGLIGEQLKRRSEQSTNFRWWDLASSQRFIQSREDLKHPPTAVGGIGLFVQSHSTAKTKAQSPSYLAMVVAKYQTLPNGSFTHALRSP
jgi:hypothetical protein